MQKETNEKKFMTCESGCECGCGRAWETGKDCGGNCQAGSCMNTCASCRCMRAMIWPAVRIVIVLCIIVAAYKIGCHVGAMRASFWHHGGGEMRMMEIYR